MPPLRSQSRLKAAARRPPPARTQPGVWSSPPHGSPIGTTAGAARAASPGRLGRRSGVRLGSAGNLEKLISK
eukprot:1436349-Prymnesium_polylepis.1